MKHLHETTQQEKELKTVHTLTGHFSTREKQTDQTNEQRPF
jgi:hypothetical protein